MTINNLSSHYPPCYRRIVTHFFTVLFPVIEELSHSHTTNIIDDVGIRQFGIQYTDSIYNVSLKYSLTKEMILTNIIDNVAIITLPTQHTHKIANSSCR